MNTKDYYSTNALSSAASCSRKHIINQLLANGHATAVKLLLEKGADWQSIDKDGRTPLAWATRNAQETIVKLLNPEGKYSRVCNHS
jgi:ankyrin repeat protein